MAGPDQRFEHQLQRRHRGQGGVEPGRIVPVRLAVLDHRPEAAQKRVPGECADCGRRVGPEQIDPADDGGNQRVPRDGQDPGRVLVGLLALHQYDAVDPGCAGDRPQIVERHVAVNGLEVRRRPSAAVAPQLPEMNVGIDHALAGLSCVGPRMAAANAATTAKQASGTSIAKRMCPVASETSPIIAVNTAPPMIAITMSEAPSLVRSPRPRMEAAKIVGNMIDMKKLDNVSAPSPIPPPTIAATAQSAMLANPKIASSRSGATKRISAVPVNRPAANKARARMMRSAAVFS